MWAGIGRFFGPVLAAFLVAGFISEVVGMMSFFQALMLVGFVWAVTMSPIAQSIRNASQTTVSFVWGVVSAIWSFILLRYIAAKALGFYPRWTSDKFEHSGGLQAFWGYDISSIILWEMCFLTVAGYIAYQVGRHERYRLVGGLAIVTLVVITFQVNMPATTATIPSRQEIDRAIAEKDIFRKAGRGIVGAIKGALENKPSPVVSKPVTSNNTSVVPQVAPQKKENTPVAITAPVTTEDPLFPASGNGVAKKGIGVQAYLDPMRTSTKSSGPAIYMLESNPAVQVEDHGVGDAVDERALAIWRKMPAGKYVVYPLGDDDITFRWWVR
jgi:hypothetical protein